uniref:Radial spoke protein 10 n=1 Tax=Chlamydomonas leiostraca TaxID=1034604 RepID=A0A7S0R255_9CHLO|mmetsp:Transcript_12043/g.29404  ORF Transcript_12043/g.29404 Transcript_12043/m.29404 type:complete len:218 (+) Transcript_12043:103-756(+)
MADDEEAPPQPVWEGAYDEEGLPHGKGVMKYPPAPVGEDEEEKPGDTYEGEFAHGKRHGKGKYTWGVSGAVYEGDYAEGAKAGRGRMAYPDKSVYEGEWAGDVPQGQGTWSYAGGDVYAGALHGGKRHGRGAYHYRSVGCQLVGEWEEGAFVRGRWVHKDGSMFSGVFEGGVQPAQGAFFLARPALLQKGSFVGGVWAAGGDPLVGKIDALAELAPV